MWKFRKNNLLINEKDKLFVHRVHLERLLHTKTHIQNKGPDMPYFMKNKLSKKEILRVKNRQKNYENSIIFSRLLEINNALSPYSKYNAPKYCPAFDKSRHNFSKLEKLERLCKQNRFLFNRFINEKSFYPTKRLLEVSDYENYLRGNIRRQHLDNPNLNFVTFKQFKMNIINNYNMDRSNSARIIRNKANNMRKTGYEFESMDKSSNSYCNYGIKTNKSTNNYNSLKKNRRRNNNFSVNSTNPTTKVVKSRSRCQSAYILRGKNNI